MGPCMRCGVPVGRCGRHTIGRVARPLNANVRHLRMNSSEASKGKVLRANRMKAKHYLLASLIYFGIASGQVFAQSGADPQIERLEQSIRALEGRVASLEAQLRERPSASQVAPAKVNWRKLKSGMTESDVEQLLGSPEKVDTNPVFVLWSYPSFGHVRFGGRSHTVDEWSEPTQ
jgi:hypothetical protein